MIRFLFIFLAGTLWLTAQTDSTLTPHERQLADKLKSPCCWSESLLVHSSPDARRLRGELAAMVRGGKSDEEVIQYFVTNYGSRILRDPPGKNQLYLHILPLIATALGLALVVWWIHRHHAHPPQPTTT